MKQAGFFMLSGLTEETNAFRRYLQRRDKAMGLEKSFTSGVPFKRKQRTIKRPDVIEAH